MWSGCLFSSSGEKLATIFDGKPFSLASSNKLIASQVLLPRLLDGGCRLSLELVLQADNKAEVSLCERCTHDVFMLHVNLSVC